MTSETETLSQDVLNEYLREKNVNQLFVQIVEAMLIEKPENPITFTFQYLMKKYPSDCVMEGGGAAAAEPAAAAEDEPEYDPTDEEDEDEMGDMEEFVPVVKSKGRKQSVMSSSVKVDADWKPPEYPKSEAEAAMLTDRIGKNLLMKHLGPKDVNIFVKAFQPMNFEQGTNIITQGAEGDLFYVIEEGTADIIIEGVNDGKPVASYPNAEGRDYFGELALLYNAPRAATVCAATPVKAWALDRVTFKTIMQDSATKQTDSNNAFLVKVPILQTMSDGDRMQLADALKPQMFQPGEVIITQGEEGNTFYIIEEGGVVCTKDGKKVSDELGTGAIFGELALLKGDKRAATVTAIKPTTCLTVDRATFNRILGPLGDILAQNQEVYAKFMA